MFDAAAAGLMLEALPDVQPYVQVGENLASIQGSPEIADEVAQINGFPQATLRLRESEIFEDQSVLAVIEIRDSSPMAHQVTIDWGDGSAVQVISVGPQTRDVLAVHKYLDDRPSGTGADSYTVTARVENALGEEVTASAVILVKNVAPQIDSLSINSPINENDTAILMGTYSDAGTLDRHVLEIDWNGDGTFDQTVTLSGGTFSVSRQILDDPSDASIDNFNVNVRLRDDDGGQADGSVSLEVNNLAPILTSLSVNSPIVENGTATLTGTYTDVGTQDTHTLDIDWNGDGNYDQTISVSGGSFSVSRQFLDDNPGSLSDSFEVNVRLRDDDGGEALGAVELTVENSNPIVMLNPLLAIDENGTAVLTGAYQDLGSQDTHVLDIDWDNDGVFEQTISLSGGAFTITRQFLDDNPTGTPSDDYEVRVRIRDDDGGADLNSQRLTVRNVSPTLTVPVVQPVYEGMVLDLAGGRLGSFVDVGTLDTHIATVNWGDGTGPQTVLIDENNGSGTLSASHIYADNGTYTVTVTVIDDDTGSVSRSFLVSVLNVDPTLTGVSSPVMVAEGQLITLDSLGIGLEDPGFDNPLAGTEETLTALTVNWGDGTGPLSLTVATEIDGGPGVTTKATFSSQLHAFADDGTYTVRVIVGDDDGGFIERSFTIIVMNADPVLTVSTDFLEILEGGSINLSGLFQDAGYNNPDNPNGPSEETFHYSVDWGDGTLTKNNKPVASVVDGSQGVKTAGTIVDSHIYADNDADNLYTIAVTLFDDDGGASEVQRINVRVLNVNPSFIDLDSLSSNVIVATDVDTEGRTILTIRFTDPGTEAFSLPNGLDPFQVLIDWGDKLGEPDAQARFVIEDRLTGIPGGILTYVHQYLGPPDPLNPAADITIRVKIRDDDFYTATPLGAVGESTVADVRISNPGLGPEPFRIDTTPQVPQLVFPVRTEVDVPPAIATNAFRLQQNVDIGATSGEAQVAADRYIELCVIDAQGNEGPGYRLRVEVLQNLPELFRSLPDNHYALYLINTETNTRRLVIEVYVRNGKLIDPGDDSEGTRDRPPTDEQTFEPAGEAASRENSSGDQGMAVESSCPRLPTSRQWTRGTALAMGLAASATCKSWSNHVDEALAQATPEQWKKLKGYNPPKRKKAVISCRRLIRQIQSKNSSLR